MVSSGGILRYRTERSRMRRSTSASPAAPRVKPSAEGFTRSVYPYPAGCGTIRM
jgi:hypothetical protein